jgi:hypothetical protein
MNPYVYTQMRKATTPDQKEVPVVRDAKEENLPAVKAAQRPPLIEINPHDKNYL